MPQLRVIEHKKIAKQTFALTLKGAPFHKPGQFIEVLLPDNSYFVRRPFSIADQENDEILIIYKVVGSGTEALSRVRVGKTLDCLTCLGNGFTIVDQQKTVYLIGGGIGIPPLYYLAKSLKKQKIKVHTVLGFNTGEDCFYMEEFERLGEVSVATLDGSKGIEGNVLDAINNIDIPYYFAVGPVGMLKAISKKYQQGQVSLEERMGCGFGACMGCSIQTKHGFKRVCKEGPVFFVEELLWND